MFQSNAGWMDGGKRWRLKRRERGRDDRSTKRIKGREEVRKSKHNCPSGASFVDWWCEYKLQNA